MHEDAYLEAQYEERTDAPYPWELDGEDGLDPLAIADWPSRYTSEDFDPENDEDDEGETLAPFLPVYRGMRA